MTEEEDRIKKGGGLANLKMMTPEERERAVVLINKGFMSDIITGMILDERRPDVFNALHVEICNIMHEIVRG